MQIISLPGIIGVVGMLFLYESPKFLLSQEQDDQALAVLKNIRSWNGGKELQVNGAGPVRLRTLSMLK